jgi:hypothetical protein
MLPTAAGKLIDVNWQEGTTNIQTYSWNYKPYVEDIEDLAIVAFIQERNTKKILQASVEYKDLKVGNPDPFSERCNLYVYPNPANRLIYVNLGYRTEDKGRIELFDIHGKIVHEEIISPGYKVIQLDIDHILEGLYLIRWIESGQVKGVNKIVINR